MNHDGTIGGAVFDLRVYAQAPREFHAVLTLQGYTPPGFARVFTGDAGDPGSAAHRAVEAWERYKRTWS